MKHLTKMEAVWLDMVLERESALQQEAHYDSGFGFGPDDTIAGALAAYDEAARATDTEIRKIDLEHPVPVPKDVPWFPDDVDTWTVRWVLLHLIEETARHAGHADIVRESIDGATMYELMAAAEGWPATEWLQPWEPKA